MKDVAAQLRDIGSRQAVTKEDAALLSALATKLEKQDQQQALVIELAAHPECPANLGLGGTIAWHREKVRQLRQRPQA